MTNTYWNVEKGFEKVAAVATVVLGNSIAFIVALVFIIIFWFGKGYFAPAVSETLRDIIHGITFLSLFIIQKSFNRFSASLHLKVNELVSSHILADNLVINAEAKTEYEINELSKEYTELAEKAKEEADAKTKKEEEVSMLPSDNLLFN